MTGVGVLPSAEKILHRMCWHNLPPCRQENLRYAATSWLLHELAEEIAVRQFGLGSMIIDGNSGAGIRDCSGL